MRRMIRDTPGLLAVLVAATVALLAATPTAAGQANPVASSATAGAKTITGAECTAERLGATIAPSAIGEPVRSVTLSAPSWVEAANGVPAHCRVNGLMASVDTASTARPINFSVVLPASWSGRAAQLGGGGMNGIVPNLTGGGPGAQGPSLLDRGFATYGSDSGHQAAFGARGGAGRGVPPGINVADDWALNEEAIRNLGYAQMKKTHDAAMVIIERAYGERPRFNYYIGTSQGGENFMLGEIAGSETVSLNITQLPSHQHAFMGSSADATSANAANGSALATAKRGSQTPNNFYGPMSPPQPLNPGSIGPIGGNQAHDNMQPYLTINWSIALQGIFPSRG